MEKKNTGLIVLVIILLITTLASVGYIVYDKFFTDDKEITKEGTEKIADVKVIDAIDKHFSKEITPYAEGMADKAILDFTLPKITSTKEKAKLLNGIILNDYGYNIEHYDEYVEAIEKDEPPFSKLTTDYNYFIKDDVIFIAVDSFYMGYAPSGGSAGLDNYFYDIKNDKILSLPEAMKLLGYTDESIGKEIKKLEYNENLQDEDDGVLGRSFLYDDSCDNGLKIDEDGNYSIFYTEVCP